MQKVLKTAFKYAEKGYLFTLIQFKKIKAVIGVFSYLSTRKNSHIYSNMTWSEID